MLVPALANVIYKPTSRLKKTLYIGFDLIYYVGRAYFLR